ncbi:MAG: hypothetical protein VYA55_10870 [Pseudomonadota bacterium]|nr:hypothetical protein [Pseudomonadota bacterium]
MSNESLSYLDDLEIYVACNDVEAITAWLSSAIKHFDVIRSSKKGCKFRCGQAGSDGHGMVVLNAGRTGFTSIWIDSKDTPWRDDVDMGRAAFAALNSEVRCVESAWTKGDDPDQWLQINAEGEHLIQWVTEET